MQVLYQNSYKSDHADITPSNSSFLKPKILAKFRWDHPKRERHIEVGYVFDQYIVISQKWCKIGTLLLWNINRTWSGHMNSIHSVKLRYFQ